ncbi:MAG: 2,3,4,5-tetrahydropyridine-2,6-dicarboxylate N-succinyltransferase [Bdellovibrionales bacterium CG10_big_fil_rev_8_21_14_0_10_45_34]|nr:MAG: 2,3,4,5-tetrahydropyridine-2,6-dicarboxylate N-succinyltransferase [Bdellovibrionales bacterium CG10_big_fil_rev_8_21_14_0_10_45_34]
MKEIIEKAYNNTDAVPAEELGHTLGEIVTQLTQGKLRVSEPISVEDNETQWKVNEWVKKAILLYFRTQPITEFQSGDLKFVDKIPLRQWNLADKVRVVPHAVTRVGAYVSPGCVLMPSYINIGAYVDEGTMVDTWATVGSCAQIGKNVHLSGGAGIGGVLEPPQAQPVIIENNCFIGSRAIIVEGVHIKQGAVIGAGVTLTASTNIIDVTGPEEKVFKGSVPANSVVIPGARLKKFPAGEFSVPCALIIGKRTQSTDSKVSLNQALRDFNVPV